ncbi:MAG: hypothetical protein K2G80_01240, partial [Bacteroidales bacterium]|nr:hypothetical protein [Bacteroidales bacterium]
MYRKITLLAAAAISCFTLAAQIRVSTPSTEMVIDASEGQTLKILYFGASLADADFASVRDAGFNG